MERVKVLGIKYIVAAIVTFSLYGMFDQTSLGRLFLISMLVIVIPYLGDLYLLPRIGNLYASISDFALYFLLYWILASSFIGVSSPVLLSSFLSAFFISICESFLYFFLYCILASIFIGVSSLVFLASIAAAFFTAISESLLHVYILERVFGMDQKSHNYPQQLQTEFAEEFDVESIKKDDDQR